MSRLSRQFHLPSAVRPSPARIGAEQARSLVDGGALAIDARRPEIQWLGCSALPEACLAASSPASGFTQPARAAA
jgi:hypothetical protein